VASELAPADARPLHSGKRPRAASAPDRAVDGRPPGVGAHRHASACRRGPGRTAMRRQPSGVGSAPLCIGRPSGVGSLLCATAGQHRQASGGCMSSWACAPTRPAAFRPRRRVVDSTASGACRAVARADCSTRAPLARSRSAGLGLRSCFGKRGQRFQVRADRSQRRVRLEVTFETPRVVHLRDDVNVGDGY